MASVPPKGGRKHPQQEFLQVDTTNILFLCGGAFVGLEDIIRKRTGRKRMGLDEGALVRILKEPKNALTKQYSKLFEMESVHLKFTEEALRAIAREAMKRKSGARGLRAIMENIMLDVMYEMPSQPNIKEVIVSEEVVTRNEPPLIVYSKAAESA